ncbi:MAG: aminotransferase class V-fold PLP-dependent enzyme [Candidatus Peribacteraceae bacterium]|nr:aminotransferase class V-fold PLP-dependent enzyme [Candidatus Peribacteraceae bacterium]
MHPLTFTIGPSKLSEEVRQDIREAADCGILEWSHRSKQWCEVYAEAVDALRRFFDVPQEYSVFFLSSATEAMERTILNLVQSESCHFTCGRFSDLFAEISTANDKRTTKIEGPWGSLPSFDPAAIPGATDLVTVTANETSTGVMCSNDDIRRIRNGKPDTLLAVDITSIAGSKVFPIDAADIWLFSVQKCIGLPAGLGIMFVSPKAMERALKAEEAQTDRAGYFSFKSMQSFEQKSQTICTPNVLNIFLLGRQMKRWNEQEGCDAKEKSAREKASRLYRALETHPLLNCFVKDSALRSHSIACIEGKADVIRRLHTLAADRNILLGKGYGKLKETTARIALFPAITEDDMTRLIEVMSAVA